MSVRKSISLQLKKCRLTLAISMLAGTAGGQAANHLSSPDKAALPPQAMAFQPGFDDLMTMLVQPRHIKLYYAGTANNWELAAFELTELRSAFKRAAQAIPVYQNNDVSVALQTFIEPKIEALDAAIKIGNAKHFVKEYSGLTAACNSCHAFMEHPFLVIKNPNAAIGSPYVDQNLTTE